MNRLSPRTTVLSGAAFGLIAGAAVFGAVSTSSASAPSPASFNPAKASSVSSASTATCAAGQQLEHGVCIVHVEHVVVRPGKEAASAEGQSTDSSQSTGFSPGQSSGPSSSSAHESESSDHAAEAAHEAAEHAAEAAVHAAEPHS